MKTAKRILLVLSVVALMVCALAIAVSAASETVTYDFSTFSGTSTQYAEETHQLTDDVTLSITGCHINSQLRIYASQSGSAVFYANGKAFTSIGFNAGNKADTFNVYGANAAEGPWTLIEAFSVTTAYADYTVSADLSATSYTYVKFASTAAQVRVKTVTFGLDEAGEVVELTDAQKVAAEKANLETETEITKAGLVNLATAGATYTDVAISWSSDSGLAVVDNEAGTVTYTLPEAGADDVVATLTATLTCGEATDTVTIPVTVVAPADASGTVTATTVEWVASEQGYTNAQDINGVEISADDYITFVLDKGTGSTTPKYYNTGTGVRLYANNTLTITPAANCKITSIVITTSGTNYTFKDTNTSVTNGAAEGLGTTTVTVTPTDGTAAVVLNNTATSGNIRIQKIAVSYGPNVVVDADATNQEKVEATVGSLNTTTEITAAGSVDVETAGSAYTDVTITWASDNALAVVDNEAGTVTYTLPEAGGEDVVVNLTATVACGDYSVDVPFAVTLVAPMTEAQIVDHAQQVLAGNGSFEGTYTLTGIVTSIDTAWSSSYANITVTMTVKNTAGEDVSIQCYRLADTADFSGEDIAVGNQITVNGAMSIYSGKIQFSQGSTLLDISVPELTDAEKVELELSTLDLITVVLENGDITVASNGATYTGVAFTWASNNEAIAVNGNTLTVTRAAENQVVTVTVTATLNAVTATKDFTVTVWADGELTDADVVDAAYLLGVGQTLSGTHTVTGTITAINTAYDSGYGNISVVIAVDGTENTILCYRLKGVGADVIAVGDEITVTGSIKNYNGTIEFDSGCTLDAYPAPVAIKGAALNINENIDMMYYVYVAGTPASISAEFTFNGATTTVTDYTVAEDGRYVFVFDGINPAQMGDTVAVTISATYATNTYTASSSSMSVKKYYEVASEVYAEDTKLLTLISDLLIYGAAAQTFIGDTDALVTEGLDLTPSATDYVAPESDLAINGESFTGASLVLGSDITVKFYFTAESTSVVNVSLNHRTVSYNVADLTADENGVYTLEFTNVLATEYADTIYVNIDGGDSMTYSVNSYISDMQEDTTENLPELLKALYIYGAYAGAYND